MSDIINFEIKSRVPNCSKIDQFLMDAGAICKGVDHQVDTYFEVNDGRLKLRQGNVENSLIFYKRVDDAKARESEIYLEKIKDESNLSKLLLRALSTKIVVDKKRKIFFIENVKFHIDFVDGLGEFIEIEAISVNNEFQASFLKKQCESYMTQLELKEKDFMNLSYSDLIGENFQSRIKRELNKFSELFLRDAPGFIVDRLSDIDHLCYRASTELEYKKLKGLFSELGDVLISAPVGGREITTFKLKTPLSFCGVSVDVLELPAPKSNNTYSTGFEHLEIVIGDTFEVFVKNNCDFEFDFKGTRKEFNPELRFEMKNGISVKFHHQTLEDVIEYEKKENL